MIYAYKQYSESAKSLADALGVKRIKNEGSKFKGNSNKVVINWGSSELPAEVEKCVVVNKAEAVGIASNKLSFFQAVEGVVQIPEFTTDQEVAKGWLEVGKTVLARSTLTGHSGIGIKVLESLEDFDMKYLWGTKLFVKYIPKKEEYRVHVVNGKVIDARRKAIRSGYENAVNWKIRNYNNGFIFAKEGFEVPQEALDQSILAVNTIGLDFGAVDVIYNNFHNKAYVLEVNTAPGIEGSTVDNYKEAFESLYRQNEGGTREDLFELSELRGKLTSLAAQGDFKIDGMEFFEILDEDELEDIPF